MQHVFIIGSKGIPGNYGGYETFVDKLTECHQNHPNIKYHVACKGNKADEKVYHNARCFVLNIPNIGAAQAIYYDIAAMRACCKYIKKNDIHQPIIYILACRIGPFMAHYSKKVHALGGRVFINPDGHEWLRKKWSLPVRKYWKFSERLMVKHSDTLICDSMCIEQYIQNEYKRYVPKTIYIAYGADIATSSLLDDDSKYVDWLSKNKIYVPFYTVIGRCVPENNYETIIKEFMKSHTEKNLVIITTDNPKMMKDLDSKLHYKEDKRVKFVGTVYDSELLTKIREKSFAYIHGHSVGGTNPSLLEALSYTKLNLLYDVEFNREVAKENALYWTLEDYNLSALIDKSDKLSDNEIEAMGQGARQRIKDKYNWKFVSDEYIKAFSE